MIAFCCVKSEWRVNACMGASIRTSWMIASLNRLLIEVSVADSRISERASACVFYGFRLVLKSAQKIA